MASAKPKKKNPRLASGRKRARQDVKLNAANTSLRAKYRTAVKNVEKAVAAGDKAKATELFAKAQSVVELELAEGKNREVRRLFESQGLVVRRLLRTQIGKIKLGELKPGRWRALTPGEIKTLLS